jgi:hypothetical protein
MRVHMFMICVFSYLCLGVCELLFRTALTTFSRLILRYFLHLCFVP